MDGDGRQGKVERVIEAYGLDGFGDELERAWTAADPNQRESLRDLATRFNERVLEAAFQTTGDTVLEGEVEHTYHLLTDDEVSPVTGDVLNGGWNGRGSISTHSDRISSPIRQSGRTSRTIEGRNRGTVDVDRREKAVETVQRLPTRLVTVAEDRLESLPSAGELSIGEFRVILHIRVVCEDWGHSSRSPPSSRGGM
jgi:hypothetical protein